jgi:hypothetical protein
LFGYYKHFAAPWLIDAEITDVALDTQNGNVPPVEAFIFSTRRGNLAAQDARAKSNTDYQMSYSTSVATLW